MHLDTCHVSAAVQRFVKDSEDEPGRLLWTEILPDGQSPVDPLKADTEEGYRALLARHGSFISSRGPDRSDEKREPGDDGQHDQQQAQ